MEKTCTTCFDTKIIESFYRNKNSKDGYKNMCKTCSNSYTYRYIQNNRDNVKNWKNKAVLRNKKIVSDYLAEHPCVDCGESDVIVLEFDHLSDKLENISNMVFKQVSVTKLLAEIAKCEVRCANCHRRITHKRRTLV